MLSSIFFFELVKYEMLVLLKTAFYVAGWLGYGGEWVRQTGFYCFLLFQRIADC